MGYISEVNKPSRINGEHQYCIDHIIVKYKDNIIEQTLPFILQSEVTDHLTIMLQIVLEHSNNSKRIYKISWIPLTGTHYIVIQTQII